MISDEELFNLLDWNSSEEEQKKGIEIGLQRKNLEIFIQVYGKNVWENCAKILAQKNDEELIKYLPQLLEWLQDLNWPGALIILKRLQKFNPKILKGSYEEAVKKASLWDGNNWLLSLSYLLENEKLKEKISFSCLKLLEKCDEENE